MLRPALVGLLAGMTGCDWVFGLSRERPDAPMADAAVDAESTVDAPGSACGDSMLRLCMLFEDELAEGQATDSSPQQNHANLSMVTSASRNAERAVRVVLGSQITIAEDTSLDVRQPATIAAWFFLDAVPVQNTGMIVLDNDGQYSIAIDDLSGVSCRAILESGPIMVRQTITVATWHHVACVYQQGSSDVGLTMYIDGHDVGSAPGLGTLVTDGTSGLRLGQNGGIGGLESGSLVGLIDDVQIWARALTASEIKTIAD